MIKRIAIFVFLFFIGFFIFEYYNSDAVKNNIKYCEEDKKKSFQGVVKKTYLDKGYFVIIYEDKNKEEMYIDFSVSNSKEVITVGDSIIKKAGSFNLVIMKKENQYKEIIIDDIYNCNLWEK